jgi:spore germination cell wall hydrolase CwlJ-like protein
MRFVAEVMRNRAGKTKTLEEVALAPHQFSAAARPDLQQFYLRQPPEVRSMATAILREIQSESYRPQYPGIRHYVTYDLWSRRMTPSSPSWLRKMKAVQRIGNHVALVEE